MDSSQARERATGEEGSCIYCFTSFLVEPPPFKYSAMCGVCFRMRTYKESVERAMKSTFVCKEYQQGKVCKRGNLYCQLRHLSDQLPDAIVRKIVATKESIQDCTDHFDHIIGSGDVQFPSTDILRGKSIKTETRIRVTCACQRVPLSLQEIEEHEKKSESEIYVERSMSKPGQKRSAALSGVRHKLLKSLGCDFCLEVKSTNKAKAHITITGLHDVRCIQTETSLKSEVIEWFESLLRVGMRKDAVLKLYLDFNAETVRPKQSEEMFRTRMNVYREQLRAQVCSKMHLSLLLAQICSCASMYIIENVAFYVLIE